MGTRARCPAGPRACAYRVEVNAALDDCIIVANPADTLGRALRLIVTPKARCACGASGGAACGAGGVMAWERGRGEGARGRGGR